MYCPNCNTLCGENDRFCTHCGTDLHPELPPVEIPAPKRGSHWVPILILAILSVIGIGMFIATTGPGRSGSSHAAGTLSETPWFEVYDGALFFYPEHYTGGSEITVPSQVNGITVTCLSDGCFENCTEITTVILPDTLEEIGSFAFSGCTSLRGIYIPTSTYMIGAEAFYNCTDLEAVYIPGSIGYIGPGAFDNCDRLYYIFYNGLLSSWDTLYAEFINPYTGIYCEDGSYYQGGNPYE